jgi:hypothetical protein
MIVRRPPVHFFIPFSATLERSDKKAGVFDDDGLLPGYAFVNEVVRGEGGVAILRSAMEAATPGYLQYGNIREMHGKNAAGVTVHGEWDDVGFFIRAKIVDPVAKLKVEEGVYKGYSIAVQPLQMRGSQVTELDWVDISLVDRPKDPDARFQVYRSEGAVEEAEVEVLPEEPETVAASGEPPAEPGSEPVTAPGADPLRADAEGSPGAADDEHPTTDDERRTTDAQPEERAATSATVPVREGLEGKAATVIPVAPGPLERYIEKCDDKWCVYSEAGDKLGEYDTKAEAVKRLRQIEGHKDERGEEAPTLLRCGCCGMDSLMLPSFGGADLAEMPPPSFTAQYQAREGGEKASLAWNILRDVLWQIAFTGGDGAEGQAREAIGQFEEVVAPIIGSAGQQRQRAELFAPFTRAADEEPTEDTERLETSSDTVLRLAALETDNASLILRAETAEGELARVLTARETLTRDLGAAKERIARLEAEPVRTSPVLYPKALTREFFANAGRQGAEERAAIIARMQEVRASPATSDMEEQQRRASEMIRLGGRLAELEAAGE